MSRNNICRLCLRMIEGEKNYTLILNDRRKVEMLSSFVPNLNLKLSKDPRICNVCAVNLQVAVDFKGIAAGNEIKVAAEAPKHSGKVNLKDIEIDQGVKKDVDSPTCRVCLKPSCVNNIPLYDEPSYAHSFKLVRSLINSCVNGLDYDLTDKPVLCNSCWILLQNVYLFKRTMVESEEKIVTYQTNNKNKNLTNADLMKLVNKSNSVKGLPQNNNENVDFTNVQIKQELLAQNNSVIKGQASKKASPKRQSTKPQTGERRPVGRPKSAARLAREAAELATPPKKELVKKTAKGGKKPNKGLMSPKAREKERFLAMFSLHTEKIIIGLRKHRTTRRSKKLGLIKDAENEDNKPKTVGTKKINNKPPELQPEDKSSVVETKTLRPRGRPPKQEPESVVILDDNKLEAGPVKAAASSCSDTSVDTAALAPPTLSPINDRPRKRRFADRRPKKINKTWELIKSANIPEKNKLKWQEAFNLLSTDNQKVLEQKVENVLKDLIRKQKAAKTARRKRILLEQKRKRLAEVRRQADIRAKNEIEAAQVVDLDNCSNNNLIDKPPVIPAIEDQQGSSEANSSTMEVKPFDADPILKNMRKITDYFKKRSEIDVSVVRLKDFTQKSPNTSALTASPNATLSTSAFNIKDEDENENDYLDVSMDHPNIVNYLKSEPPPPTDDERKYQCNICSFRTRRKNHLFRHLMVHGDPDNLTNFPCPYCPYKTIKKQYLKSHMLTHDPDSVKFQCQYCQYMTNRKDRLRLHTMTHLPDTLPKIFKCPQCPYSSSRKTNLKCHMIGHETEARFACQECEYKTKRKSHLVTHMLKHADPEMVYIYHCMHCPYRAKRKHHLEIHILKGCKGRKEL